jgi:hypothetical protein
VNRGPVYLIGTGESIETPMVSQMADFTSSRAFRVAGPKAFAEAGITHNDVDHLMIYDAPCSLPGASFAHLPIYGLADLGFVPRGEAGAFIAERNTPRRHVCPPHDRDIEQGAVGNSPASRLGRDWLCQVYEIGRREPVLVRFRTMATPASKDRPRPSIHFEMCR